MISLIYPLAELWMYSNFNIKLLIFSVYLTAYSHIIICMQSIFAKILFALFSQRFSSHVHVLEFSVINTVICSCMLAYKFIEG